MEKWYAFLFFYFNSVLTDVTYLIGSEDLKLHFVETCWRENLTLK